MKIESMMTPAVDLKFDAGEAMTFSGYGARFGNVDAYGDVIAPGAFAKTLREAKSTNDWPAMLMQHGGMLGGELTPVGVWTEMHEDEKGLWVEGKLADTERGREAYTLLKMEPRPAIRGLSIGYKATDFVRRAKPEDPRRTLKEIKLFEVSLVTFPANRDALVEGVKSIETIREFEAFLRDVGGFSREAAKQIASSGFKSDPRDEAGDVAAALRRNIETLS